MRDFLFSLFEVSLTMGAVAALLLALFPVWKRRFRPQWRYWAWLLVALRLAVPLNIPLPQAPVTLEAPAPVELSAAWVDEGAEGFRGVEFAARPAEDLPADRQTGTSQAEEGGASPAATGFSLTLAEAAFAVWLAGAAGVLAVQLARYAAFRRHTRRWSAPAGEYEGIPVQICALLSAPVLVGLARPRILLPEGLTGEKRAYALAHEAAHAKRRDLWYKALLLWVCALHWFNPLVWALRRSAERDVEICCDAAALAGRDEGWRQGYGAALLSFVSARPAAPLTSQFAGGVRGLKERFRALVSAAPARRGRIALALVLCAALLGGSLVACRPQETPEETTPPTGTPLAIRLTLIPAGLISLLIYIAVVSPSRLEFVAIMTSSTSPCRRSISSFRRMSPGPMPSIGEMAPWRTWYTPLYFPVFSYAARSRGDSTTMMVFLSRSELLHMGQISRSVSVQHSLQYLTFFLASTMACAIPSTWSMGILMT